MNEKENTIEQAVVMPRKCADELAEGKWTSHVNELPLGDLISRKALVSAIENNHPQYNDGQDIADWQMQCINNALTIDARPVQYGEWLPHQTSIETRQSGWICNQCFGVVYDVSNGDTDYCPSCGARMDGDEHAAD